jgi:hypothetical protein
MTKLEQVALSLFDCTAEQWARKSANFREAAMKDVRRSVEALREPGDTVMRALTPHLDDSNEDNPLTSFDGEEVWRGCIDAILSEKPD